MARLSRMESESGVYHVLNRGNYRTDIFRSDKAKSAFLSCLGETREQTGWEIHAWCLMLNHFLPRHWPNLLFRLRVTR